MNMKKSRLAKIKAIVIILALLVMTGSLYGCGKPIAEIPDPEYFFENTYIDEINEHDDVKQVILRSDDELWTYAAAYVNLLKYSGKYEFEILEEGPYLYVSSDYKWSFKYSGSEEAKDMSRAQIDIVYYSKINERDKYALWITIDDLDNFELVQNDRYGVGMDAYTPTTAPATSATSATSSWNSGSSWDDDDSDWDSDDDFWDDDNDDLYDAKVQCGVCDGDGDCNTCGGDGYLYSSASGEEDRNCYSCSGSGNCRSCGGDGEL